jgi:type III secretion YscU/HrpY family protein
MADDKSEQPTPKRLKDARQKGQVSKSNDLTQAALFLTATGVISISGTFVVNTIKSLMIESFSVIPLVAKADQTALLNRFAKDMANVLVLSAPLLGALFIISAAVNFLQIGGLIFSFQILTPKFTKLNPVQGFQNIFFKSRTYIELIKNLIKFAVIFWLAWTSFRSSIRDVLVSARIGISETAALTSQLLFGLLFKVGSAFLILGAADFLIQKKLYIKGLMMSKEEVKREYKEDEGDPHIKHQRKHLHEEILSQSMMNNVPKATAVVVNPTHLAIALNYDQARMAAPRVTAKGQMLMAQKIIEIAEQAKVPVVRNVELAHRLYPLEMGSEIPEDLYEAVAEIFDWVYRLTEMQGE